MIILNKEQAEKVRGKYGKYSELNPILCKFKNEDVYFLPENVLKDNEFKDVWEFLQTLPKGDITLISEAERY